MLYICKCKDIIPMYNNNNNTNTPPQHVLWMSEIQIQVILTEAGNEVDIYRDFYVILYVFTTYMHSASTC